MIIELSLTGRILIFFHTHAKKKGTIQSVAPIQKIFIKVSSTSLNVTLQNSVSVTMTAGVKRIQYKPDRQQSMDLDVWQEIKFPDTSVYQGQVNR